MSENKEKEEQTNCEKKDNIKTSQIKKEEKPKSKVNISEQQKEKDKKKGVIARTVAIVAILIIIIAIIYLALPSPARALQQMLRELKTANYDKVNEYVDNDLIADVPIFSNEEGDEEAKKLLFEDLQFKVKNIKQEGDKATISLEVTNKNFKTILQNYTQKVMQKTLFNSEESANSEDNMEKILIEELKNKDIDKATSVQEITMEKIDKKWKVVVDNNLKNAILPNLEEAIQAITGGIDMLQ